MLYVYNIATFFVEWLCGLHEATIKFNVPMITYNTYDYVGKTSQGRDLTC